MNCQKKNARSKSQPGVSGSCSHPAVAAGPTRLTLGELGTLARLAQTDLLALHFTGVTGHITGRTQGAAQRLVVFHQGTGDAVANCTGLTEAAAAFYRYVEIKFII